MTISFNNNNNSIYTQDNSGNAASTSDDKTQLSTETKQIEIFPAKNNAATEKSSNRRHRVYTPVQELTDYIQKNNIKDEYVQEIVDYVANESGKKYVCLSTDVCKKILDELKALTELKKTIEAKGLNLKETVGEDDIYALDPAMCETYSNILKQCKKRDTENTKLFIKALMINEKYDIANEKELARYTTEQLNSFVTAIKTIEEKFNNNINDIKKYLSENKLGLQLNELAKIHNIDLKLYYVDNVAELRKDECKRLIKNLQKGIEDQYKNQKIDYANRGLDYHVSELCKKYNINQSDIKNSKENFIKAVEFVEKNELSSGKLDKNTIKRHILDYTTALDYEWDYIEDFIKWNKDKTTLRKRLIEAHCLSSKKTSRNEIIYATRKYFNEILPKRYDTECKIKKPKTKAEIEEVKTWYKKLYNQTLGKLLINTPEKDKKELLYAAKYGSIGNKNSEFENSQTKMFEHIIMGMSDDDKLSYIKDCLGNIYEITKDNTNINDTAKLVKVMAGELPAKELVNISNQQTDSIIAQKEKVEDAKKEAKKDPNNIEKQNKVREEEEKLNNNLENGEIINEEIVKRADNGEINIKDAEAHIRQNDNRILEKDPDLLKRRYRIRHDLIINDEDKTPEIKEKLIKLFDNISNHNFLLIINNPNAELNPPTQTNDLSIDTEKSEVGLPQKSDNITAANENIQEIAEIIEEQTREHEEPNTFVVESNNSQKNEEAFLASFGKISRETAQSTAETVNALLQNVKTISVVDIKEFSISLTPLMKQFSELATSVQNHIKTRLESRSEDEQIHSIDQMDKNSDKVDLALQLKISSDKLKELHLDTNAKKNLELQEEIA